MLANDPETLDLPAALACFAEHGYARLGVWAAAETLHALRERCDDIMLGRVPTQPFFFQHDSASGRYEDLAYGEGWVGPSLDYRKVEHLERDPLFWRWMTNPVFERVARALIPGSVTLYRALLFGKSATGGTELPWHQDGGEFWGLDREPFLQLWTALDDAPIEAGCVDVLPGSHKPGLATKDGGVVPKPLLAAAHAEARALALPARAGEVILLHNHVWHRSHRNTTQKTRRGFTVCLLDGRTQCRRKKRAPRQFVTVFP
jgi:hypothetical protein